MIKIDKKLVEMVSWDKNPNSYDYRLHQLGKTHDEFIIVNPAFDDWILEYIDTSIDCNECVVWARNEEWIAKKFKKNWNPSVGWKIVNVELNPIITFNPEVSNIKFDFDLKSISTYDLKYECIWYIGKRYTKTEENIWAIKVKLSDDIVGSKDMGKLTPLLKEKMDVIFISYDEPNAEENWEIVKSKDPDAQRIHGVKGIFEAHKEAAKLADTDMFWVVDGDARLLNDWKFNYQPNIFNREFIHVWSSINPINNLEYGYGGVKLFPRKLLLDADTWSLDVATSLGNVKIMNRISNIAAFNTGEYSVWRSAFRECAKLASGNISNQLTEETQKRLTTWLTTGSENPFGEYCIAGAKVGYQFGIENKNNPEVLANINDRDWLRKQFEEFKFGKTGS